MKKFLLLISIIYLLPTLSFAEFDLGVKVGYSASKFSTDAEQFSTDFKNGFAVGAFGKLGYGIFFLQPELIYSIDGSKITYKYDGQTITPTITQNSIDLALLAGINLTKSESLFQLNLQGGLFTSIVTDKGLSDLPDVLAGTDFKNLVYGIKLGVGAEFSNIVFHLRYITGLNNIYKDGIGLQNVDMKNVKIEFAVGIKLLSF